MPGINTDKIKQFLKREDIQEALQDNDIEYIYDKFYAESNGFTNLLTRFLLSIGVEPVKFVNHTLYRYYYELTPIKNITIPNNVKTIGNSAFSECYELEEVTIEDGVESIGQNAFHGCHNLLKVYIPDSVETMFNDSFSNASPFLVIYCNENSYAHEYCQENEIPCSLLNKRINESLTEEQETLIEDVQDNAHEEQRIIDDIRKLFVAQDFGEEEKLNGIAFTQEIESPEELLAQFYIDTTDLSHSCYIKSEDESFTNNYSNKGDKDSLQKSAALFIKQFIDITTADII